MAGTKARALCFMLFDSCRVHMDQSCPFVSLEVPEKIVLLNITYPGSSIISCA